MKENKQSSQIQWLSHYYLPQKISNKYSKNIFGLIKQFLNENFQKFGKAVIYATQTKSVNQIATSLQNLNQLRDQPNKNIVIMNSSHSKQQIKQKQRQFILSQSKILITTLQPEQTFKNGVIDVENVNLIINQVLPTTAGQYKARLVKSKWLDQSCRGVVINMIKKNSSGYFNNIQALKKQLNISISEYTPMLTKLKITNAKQSPHKLNKYQSNQTNNLLGLGPKFDKQKPSLITTIRQEDKEFFPKQKMSKKTDSKGIVQLTDYENPKTLNKNKINQQFINLRQSRQFMSKQDKFNNLNLNRPLNSNKNLQYENQIKKEVTQKKFQISPQRQQKTKGYLAFKNNKKVQQSPDSNQLIQQNYSPYYKQFSGSNGSQNQKQKNSRIRQHPYISQYKQADQIENIKIKQNYLKNKIEDETALNTNKNQKIIQQTIRNCVQPLLKQIKQSIGQVLVELNDVEKNIKKQKQIREEITNNMSKATTQMISQINQAKQLYRQFNKNQNAVGQTQLQKQLINKLEKVQQGNKKIQQNVYQFQSTLNKFFNQKYEQKKPSNEVIPVLINRIQETQKTLKDTMMTSVNQLQKKLTKAYKEEILVILPELAKLKEAIAYSTKHNRTIQQSRSQNNLQPILTQNNKQIKKQLMDLQQKIKNLTKIVQNQQPINRDHIDRLDKSRQQKMNSSPKIDQSRIRQQRQQQIKIKNQQGQINSLKIQLSDKLKTIQQLNHKQKYQKPNIEKNKTLELINQTLQIYEPSMLLTEQNIQRQLPQFIYRRSKKELFLVQSDMYENMRDDLKQFVYSAVKKYCRSKQIIKTRKLFEADKNSQFHNWLSCLQKKSHILVLVYLSNGFIIGGFSQSFYDSQRYKEIDRNARGCMMSVTKKRVYDLKPKYYGRALKPDDYLFFLGNNQLKLNSRMEFEVLFTGIYRFFEAGSDTIQDFIGQKETKGTYQQVQFHQIYLK